MKKTVLAFWVLSLILLNPGESRGASIENPVISTEENSVEEVISNYLEAIGGKQKLMEVRNLETVTVAEFQGMSLEIHGVSDRENQRLLNETKMNGNLVAKTVFKDNKGTIVAMGQEKELESDQLKALLSQTYIFPELHLEDLELTATYEGEESVNGEKAHKLKLKASNGVESTEYYSVESGLKLKTASGMTGEIVYGDYQEVEGILMPMKMTISSPNMPMSLEGNVKSIKFNQNLDDAIFE
ncbi:peptidase, M16 family protein [Echinicola jeungdonensis]|uniref:Peptidase, M16 family protein n=1 Tax=Echinicola jeungdonensis TaxID=709343 RepID=A0ABV5J607_9BACT|nr:peptidase, M16 family protein [Echinicola jeungdonensis]MDN3669567.1 peptidase, M16 family protein [Echinicola jeungdonensis]